MEEKHLLETGEIDDRDWQETPVIVNYKGRQKAEKTFTSQVAESDVESLINARHKRSGKMQWTRKGAHYSLAN